MTQQRRVDIEFSLDGRVERALTQGTQNLSRGLESIDRGLQEVDTRARGPVVRGLGTVGMRLRDVGEDADRTADRGLAAVDRGLGDLDGRLRGPVVRGLTTVGRRLRDVGDNANRAANRGLDALSGRLRSLPGPLGAVGGLLASVLDSFKSLPGPAKLAALAIGGIGLGAGLSILAAVNAVNGALERYRDLRRQAFDARLTFAQTQRAGAAFGQLGIAPEEGADLLGNALDELRRRRGEALDVGPLAGLQEDLGIDARARITGEGAEAFRQGVELIRELARERGADTAAFAASEIFGGDIERLVPRITAASEEELAAFFNTLERGAVLSEDARRNLEDYSRAQGGFSRELDLLRLTVGAGLAPAFAGLTQDLVPLIRTVREWAQEGDGLEVLGMAIADAFRTLGDVLTRNLENGNLERVLLGVAGGIRLFADALNILFEAIENNPSAQTLFRGLGAYNRLRDQGAEESLTQGLTGSSRPSVTSGATAEDILGARGVGVNITQTIMQQPGEDTEALARRVNRAIEQSLSSLPSNY